MDKIKIAFSYLAYPLTMANYYRKALERRKDVELFTLGAFTGQYIPWNGGMQIPNKYRNQVDLPLPVNMIHPSWEQIKDNLPWKPDLSLTVDAGWSYSSKPDCLSATIGTDPHVLDYTNARKVSDKFFNMQSAYMQDGDILLPYAFDPEIHYPVPSIIKEYDCSIIGLHYPNRDEWVSKLRQLGVSVNYRIGDIYDEYREENNKAWIGLNWSSLNDVTARVFEICAMKLVPVFNRLDGLTKLGFVENEHYLGFSNMVEAVEKVLWAKSNPEKAAQIAENAYHFVTSNNMVWDNRIDKLLHEMNFL